jgi:hypothetical protein
VKFERDSHVVGTTHVASTRTLAADPPLFDATHSSKASLLLFLLPLAPLESICAIQFLLCRRPPGPRPAAALSSSTPLLSPPLITSLSLTTTLRPNTTLLRHTHHAETSSLRANYYYALISHRRTRLPHGSGSQLSPLQASCIPPSTTAPLNRARRSPPDILVTTPTRRPRATTTSPSPRAALHPATLL